jgi:hypothetical protein
VGAEGRSAAVSALRLLPPVGAEGSSSTVLASRLSSIVAADGRPATVRTSRLLPAVGALTLFPSFLFFGLDAIVHISLFRVVGVFTMHIWPKKFHFVLLNTQNNRLRFFCRVRLHSHCTCQLSEPAAQSRVKTHPAAAASYGSRPGAPSPGGRLLQVDRGQQPERLGCGGGLLPQNGCLGLATVTARSLRAGTVRLGD